ncbi:OprD family outer membrane porin [Sulfurospirillum barnesii]|uniref:Outer membrane porin, OprD family n=1 Tax=Sulfurospirillum barnesii (strain ATCC 700032 / DSM 10660 / SES-3) TaxID=760154 RepID=I3XZY0_SULBS|nr:OprD family outer membrane porin [Sulfurospirillum barnesii]AFL69504.1 outer membrane porin, OprD family [Sulfurospirillum barnesii SES-3]
MKLVKLSLAALMSLSTMAYAADTLADAFKNGKVTGELRFVYTAGSETDATTQTAPVNNVNVGSVAAELKYVTDSLYGFKLGMAFQSAHDLGFHKKDYDGTPGGQPASEDDERNSVSTTLLSEAYIQYTYSKSNIMIGRQKIKTPLIMTSSAFALEDSFDAAVLTINEIPDTMVKLMYIQDWQMRYGSDARNTATQKDMHLKKGIYSLFFVNKSIQGLTVDGQYMTTNENARFYDAPVFVGAGGYDQYYLQAEYKLPISFPLSLAITYAGADYDSRVYSTPGPTSQVGGDDARLYGFKASTEISGVKLNVAYTTMDEEANFPGTLGHVPDTIAYTDMLTNNAIFAGVDAYSVEAIYGFGVPGLSTGLKYAHYDQSTKGIANAGMNLDGADEINIDIKYAFSGALKGFSTRLWAGYGTYDHVSGDISFMDVFTLNTTSDFYALIGFAPCV